MVLTSLTVNENDQLRSKLEKSGNKNDLAVRDWRRVGGER
jgi:hypothetical protein